MRNVALSHLQLNCWAPGTNGCPGGGNWVEPLLSILLNLRSTPCVAGRFKGPREYTGPPPPKIPLVMFLLLVLDSGNSARRIRLPLPR